MALVIAGASPDALAATSRTDPPPVRSRIHDQTLQRASGSPLAREAVPGTWKPRWDEKDGRGRSNRANVVLRPQRENRAHRANRALRANDLSMGGAAIVVRFEKRGKRSGRLSRSKSGRAVRVANLRVTDSLRRKLGDLYYEEVRNEPGVRRRDVVGPINIRYGKVVRKGRPRVVFYAIGDTALFGELFDRKLLPHVWRKPGANRKWAYLGPTPRGTCVPGLVPRRLANAWGVECG